MITQFFRFLLPSILTFHLSGCAAGVAVGASAGSLILEERSAQQGVQDQITETRILNAFFKKDIDTLTNVSVEVYEKRVLLYGSVPTIEKRTQAAKLAWQQENVIDVINEITIMKPGNLTDTAQDTWIATQLLTAITIDEQIRAVNYSIEVSGAHIYLFGIAQNIAELERVVAHAKDIPRVRRVIHHHVLMKDDPSRVKS